MKFIMINLVIAFIILEIGGFIISTNWLSHIKEDLMVLGFNRNNMLGSGDNKNINTNTQNNTPKVGQELIEGNAMPNGNSEMNENSATKGGIFNRLSGREQSRLGKVAGGILKTAVGGAIATGGAAMTVGSLAAKANKKYDISRKFITGVAKPLVNGVRYKVAKVAGSAVGFVGKHANNAKNFVSNAIPEDKKRKIKGVATKIKIKGQNAKYAIQKKAEQAYNWGAEKAEQAYNWGAEKKEFIQGGLDEFYQFGVRTKNAVRDVADTAWIIRR